MGVIVEMIKTGGRESYQNLCIKSYMERTSQRTGRTVLKEKAMQQIAGTM